jgi:glycosyltransferase involved in cell wall biosynthesis
MLHRTQAGEARHILTYAQTLRRGGVERALLRMCAGWVREGRRVTLVLGSCEGLPAEEWPRGVELVELGSPRYRSLFGLWRQVRVAAPDLIFCPGNYYSGIAGFTWLRLWLGRACPPIVGKVSNALVRPDMNAPLAWIYRRWLRLHPIFLFQLVAMTPAMATEAIAEMRMPAGRVSVIANPPAQPQPDAAPVALPNSRYIVGVGRLEPQKRWDRLIAAMPRLADKDVTLVLIGEGSERERLQAQIAGLGLQDRVTMPGHAGDPLPIQAGAAVAALTSDYEGVPGVLREALSQGTPVVATESSVAVREIVHAPELGTVVPRDDGDALVAALDHWLVPGQVRPQPVTTDDDPIADYLALFDRVAAQRSR